MMTTASADPLAASGGLVGALLDVALLRLRCSLLGRPPRFGLGALATSPCLGRGTRRSSPTRAPPARARASRRAPPPRAVRGPPPRGSRAAGRRSAAR